MNKAALVTGASGFIGQSLCGEMLRQGWHVKAAVSTRGRCSAGSVPVLVGDINGETDWSEALVGVGVVIHLAARVHVMKERAADPLAEFSKVNLHGTVKLARQCASAGVMRLVYVSTIGVNGNSTTGRQAYSEQDAAHPHNAYAISKWQAEQALHSIAQSAGLEVVMVRPPLVYGPDAKGNFQRLMAAIKKGIPLPLASAHNVRSLIYLENLVSALIACASHPAAAGHTYLVCDGVDISTSDLIRALGAAVGHPARLFSCPPPLLQLAGKLLGKSDQVDSLLGSLQLDGDKIRRDLNWTPPYTLHQGLQATAEWYRTKT